eukprot:scaffold2998_cov390-Prasinococcus_capsulatus_cf.AAC.3
MSRDDMTPCSICDKRCVVGESAYKYMQHATICSAISRWAGHSLDLAASVELCAWRWPSICRHLANVNLPTNEGLPIGRR